MGNLASVSWAMWLAAPVLVTMVAALFLWWRARVERSLAALRTPQTISAHRAYLDALRPRSFATGVGPERAHELPG
jgi:hypothetical protein